MRTRDEVRAILVALGGGPSGLKWTVPIGSLLSALESADVDIAIRRHQLGELQRKVIEAEHEIARREEAITRDELALREIVSAAREATIAAALADRNETSRITQKEETRNDYRN